MQTCPLSGLQTSSPTKFLQLLIIEKFLLPFNLAFVAAVTYLMSPLGHQVILCL